MSMKAWLSRVNSGFPPGVGCIVACTTSKLNVGSRFFPEPPTGFMQWLLEYSRLAKTWACSHRNSNWHWCSSLTLVRSTFSYQGINPMPCIIAKCKLLFIREIRPSAKLLLQTHHTWVQQQGKGTLWLQCTGSLKAPDGSHYMNYVKSNYWSCSITCMLIYCLYYLQRSSHTVRVDLVNGQLHWLATTLWSSSTGTSYIVPDIHNSHKLCNWSESRKTIEWCYRRVQLTCTICTIKITRKLVRKLSDKMATYMSLGSIVAMQDFVRTR